MEKSRKVHGTNLKIGGGRMPKVETASDVDDEDAESRDGL